MTTLATRGKFMVLTSVVALWGTLIYACSVEDENPGSTRGSKNEAGAEGSINTNNDPDAPLGAPICGKYGGYDKVKTISAGIIARVASDCRIGGPVSALQGEAAQHFAECFEIQVGGAFQCPGISYVAGTTKDSNGKTCRSMGQAHQGMNLRKADFEAFLEDIASEFTTQGITTDDIRAVAPVFEGTRTSIVQTNNQPDRNTFCECPNNQFNGKPCNVIQLNDGGGEGGNDGGTDAADASDG